jgi:ABC-2 type transport system permease protein
MKTALRKTEALFIKDLRDVIKNPAILLSCLFPVLFVVLQNKVLQNNLMPDGAGNGTSELLLSNAFCLSAGFIGSMAALYSIAEEKEKKTLRTLMLANVRAEQIFFSKGLVALAIVTAVNAICFLLLDGAPTQLLIVLPIGMLGALPIILISLVLGLAGRDQMTAGVFGLPILLIALAPLFGRYMDGVGRITGFSPTGGMDKMIHLLQNGRFCTTDMLMPLAITVVWIAVSFLVYAMLFKRLLRDN